MNVKLCGFAPYAAWREKKLPCIEKGERIATQQVMP